MRYDENMQYDVTWFVLYGCLVCICLYLVYIVYSDIFDVQLYL